jgi:signal recognition particle GTPase
MFVGLQGAGKTTTVTKVKKQKEIENQRSTRCR